MKRTKLKKKSKVPISRLKNKLWELCRQIQIKKYGSICFTCGNHCEGSSRHLGHFIPSSVGGVLLRYNLDNLRIQCYRCNMFLSGNWPAYSENLRREIGDERVEALLRLRHQTVKADEIFYQNKINEYQEIFSKES